MRKVRDSLARMGSALEGAIRLRMLCAVLLLCGTGASLAQSTSEISFATNRFAVSETDGFALVVVTRTSDVGAMMVDLIAENGTATNGVDFSFDPATNTIVFAHFQTAITVPIEIIDNTTTNQSRQVTGKLTLANPRPVPGQVVAA